MAEVEHMGDIFCKCSEAYKTLLGSYAGRMAMDAP